jgi:hypothetical protein
MTSSFIPFWTPPFYHDVGRFCGRLKTFFSFPRPYTATD